VKQTLRAALGAVALATMSISAAVAFAPQAYAETSQAQALADAITTAANSVSGNGPRATNLRKDAVAAAIEQFMRDNGIDPSSAPALISSANGLLPATVSALPGVASGESAAQTEIASTANTQSKTNNPSRITTNNGVVSAIVTGTTVVTSGGGGNPYGK